MGCVMHLFKKHLSDMNEMSWEGLQSFLSSRKNLLVGDLHTELFSEKALICTGKIGNMCEVLDTCIGSIHAQLMEK